MTTTRAADGERLERRREARGADELEDDVVGAALVDVAGDRRPGRAQRRDRLVQGGVAHRGDDVRPGERRKLYAGRADAAGRAGDQHAVAEREARLPEQGVVGRRVRLHEAAGLLPARGRREPRSACASSTRARSAWAPPPTSAITRSPTANRVTRAPTAATSPAISRPGMSCGHPGGAGYPPARWLRSAPLTPAPARHDDARGRRAPGPAAPASAAVPARSRRRACRHLVVPGLSGPPLRTIRRGRHRQSLLHPPTPMPLDRCQTLAGRGAFEQARPAAPAPHPSMESRNACSTSSGTPHLGVLDLAVGAEAPRRVLDVRLARHLRSSR